MEGAGDITPRKRSRTLARTNHNHRESHIMAKRILLAGDGPHQEKLLDAAHRLGAHTVAFVEHTHDAPPTADDCVHGAPRDPNEIQRIAAMHDVHGILAASAAHIEAAAQAAARLGLPTVGTTAAAYCISRAAQHRALDAANVPAPPRHTAHTVSEAARAAKQLGLPTVVSPDPMHAAAAPQRVDYIEDMPLAFARTAKYSPHQPVMLERYMEGAAYEVIGFRHDGQFHSLGIAHKQRMASPYILDAALEMPATLSDSQQTALHDLAAHAVEALELDTSPAHIEITSTHGEHYVSRVTLHSEGEYTSADLLSIAHGIDFWADAVRLALGEPPSERQCHTKGAALRWIESHSGHVTEIAGVEEARALPGVETLTINTNIGDKLGHVVDCRSRDQIGYAVASGNTATEAAATAQQAVNQCTVVTHSDL